MADTENARPAVVVEAATDTAPAHAGSISAAPLRFSRLLTILLLAGAAQRLVLIVDYTTNDPFSLQPISDARVYWDWAGRIAAGHLVDREPFFAGPLYAYVLAPLRLAGGGLVAAYVLNALLDLATAALLAAWIRRRTGPGFALLGAAVFLLMFEPAAFSLRTLPISLQMFLVCVVARAMDAVRQRGSMLPAIGAGAALGLFALSYPAGLILVPIAALWCCAATPPRAPDTPWSRTFLPALAVLAAGLLTISPATLHNHHATGEWIAVTAHSGITFAHGNNPRAAGMYSPAAGVSAAREDQNADARREVEQVLGRPATWAEVNRHFRNRGLEFWQTRPWAAVQLMGRKIYWFLTGLHYGDIYSPLAERREGLLRSLWLAPVHTAWLMPIGLVALIGWLRRPVRCGPELVLFLLPVLVALIFFYSPRYRAPIIPVLVIAATVEIAAIHAAWRSRRSAGQLLVLEPDGRGAIGSRWRAIAPIAALAVGVALPAVNAATDFDGPTPPPAEFWCDIAYVLQMAGHDRDAAQAYEASCTLDPCQRRALPALSLLLLENGQPQPAEHYARRAVECDPNNILGLNQLAAVLIMQERYAEALSYAEQAVGLDPDSAAAHTRVAVALVELDRPAEALQSLRRAHQLLPRDPVIATNLAWFLATVPGLTVEDRQSAVPLAENAATATRRRSIRPLATLAAAYAANDRLDEAIRTLDEAIRLAESLGESGEAEQLTHERDRYQPMQARE